MRNVESSLTIGPDEFDKQSSGGMTGVIITHGLHNGASSGVKTGADSVQSGVTPTMQEYKAVVISGCSELNEQSKLIMFAKEVREMWTVQHVPDKRAMSGISKGQDVVKHGAAHGKLNGIGFGLLEFGEEEGSKVLAVHC